MRNGSTDSIFRKVEGVPNLLSGPGFRRTTNPMAQYLSLAIYLGLAALLAAGLVFISGKLSPSRPSAAKSRPYECGVSELDSIQHRWPVRFALVAMLFLIFDVEALFFYPWAVLAARAALERHAGDRQLLRGPRRWLHLRPRPRRAEMA